MSITFTDKTEAEEYKKERELEGYNVSVQKFGIDRYKATIIGKLQHSNWNKEEFKNIAASKYPSIASKLKFIDAYERIANQAERPGDLEYLVSTIRKMPNVGGGGPKRSGRSLFLGRESRLEQIEVIDSMIQYAHTGVIPLPGAPAENEEAEEMNEFISYLELNRIAGIDTNPYELANQMFGKEKIPNWFTEYFGEKE